MPSSSIFATSSLKKTPPSTKALFVYPPALETISNTVSPSLIE